MSWPRLDLCGRCGERVLLARGRRQGHPFKLEAVEVLPAGPCGACSGRGTVRVRLAVTGVGGRAGSDEVGAFAERRRAGADPVACYACGGSGVRGEEIDGPVVAVNAAGVARKVPGPEERGTGEALHRSHRCAPAVEQRVVAAAAA